MSVAQMFPKTVEEFMEEYKMVDKDHVYSNGIEYVPIFRMKQWFEHISKQQTKQQATVSSECVSRQKAKDAIDMALDHIDHVPTWVYDNLLNALNEVPSVKPIHTTPSNTLDISGCVERQAAIDAMEKIDRVFKDLGLSCAYDMPGFWCHDGKDYKVIPTKYHKGYQQALSDAEKRIKLIFEELCYG